MRIQLKGYDNKWAPYSVEGERLRNRSYEVCLLPRVKSYVRHSLVVTRMTPDATPLETSDKVELVVAACWGRWSTTLIISWTPGNPWKGRWA